MAQRVKQKNNHQKREILGVLIMAFALLVFLGLISYHPSDYPNSGSTRNIQNWLGIAGSFISYYLYVFTIGYSCLIFPFLIFLFGWNLFLMRDFKPYFRLCIYLLLLGLFLSTALALPEAVSPEGTRFGIKLSGLMGLFIAQHMHRFLGTVGSIIVLITFLILFMLTATSWSMRESLIGFQEEVRALFRSVRGKKRMKKLPETSKDVTGEPGRPEIRIPKPDTAEEVTSGKQPLRPEIRDMLVRKPESGKSETGQRPGAGAAQRPGAPGSSQAGGRPSGIPGAAGAAGIPGAAGTGQTQRPGVPISGVQGVPGTGTAQRPGAPITGAAQRPGTPGAPGTGPAQKPGAAGIPGQAPQEPPIYHFPPIDLLVPPPAQDRIIDREALERKAHFLEERLREFDINGHVVGVEPGPIITRFEVRPAPGVKVSRFISIQDDLALVLQAQRVRVVAPIPGKAAVGVEIPNDEPATVALREILESKTFHRSPSKLSIALGKTIDGHPYVTDLAVMPHLLVAGATGSGKSVCLNTIITSILYRATPQEVKFVLIDPKKLELSLYRKLRHHHLTHREDLDEDVVTTVNNAVAMLRSLEVEMEKRYRTLARAGVRNIDDFNKAVKEKRVSPQEDGTLPEPLPYVILVVDELGDLMVTGAREIEEPIARLAQMSRAVGIHLIVATQRPSVDVITGVIKANFPSRIAFQVATKADSRTILDQNGAEKLLGRGDMLFMHPREAEPIRVHGAFVSTEEVQRVVAHISKQPVGTSWRLPSTGSKESGESGGGPGERDELFAEAARLVIRHQQGSASLLQRRLRVGYARAGRLIDELEEAGILGPPDGSKAREVLVDESFLENLDNMENEEETGEDES